MRHLDQKPNYHITHGLYGIPWRSLVAADCDNLLVGGRLISATHLAAGSARVMATCAVIGQGLGTGVALAKRHGIDIRDVKDRANELQQLLLKDDAYLCGVANTDPKDASLLANVRASSHHAHGNPERLLDGQQRNRPELRPYFIKDKKNNPPPEDGTFAEGSAWISAPLSEDPSPWIELQWEDAQDLVEIRPIFDSNLSFDISQSSHMRGGREGMLITLVQSFSLVLQHRGETRWEARFDENRRRNPIVQLPLDLGPIDTVRLKVHATWGSAYARVFALRCQQG